MTPRHPHRRKRIETEDVQAYAVTAILICIAVALAYGLAVPS